MAPVFIVTIVIAASLILVKMVLDYNRAKMIDESSSDPRRSLPASELTTLIRESVAEEIRPLAEKIERLERRTADEESPRIDAGDAVERGEEPDHTSRPVRER